MTQDRANRIPWPPLLYGGLFALAYALEKLAPVDMRWASALRLPGIAVAIAGLAIALAGAGFFKLIGTNINPAGQALKLATGCIYRYTRNPMYLGALVLFTGLGLAIPSVWLIVLVPFVAAALRQLAILPEEAYLARRFGDAYRDYQTKVRRWI